MICMGRNLKLKVMVCNEIMMKTAIDLLYDFFLPL